MSNLSSEQKMQFIEIWYALDEKHTEITQNIVRHIAKDINDIDLLLGSVQNPPDVLLN